MHMVASCISTELACDKKGKFWKETSRMFRLDNLVFFSVKAKLNK